MTDNMRIVCVVDGEPSLNAFSVKASPVLIVDELKTLIKIALSPQFEKIVAKDLTLWHVSIPTSEDGDETSIMIDNITSDHKKKLSPLTRLSKVFSEELPEETINIIVQRPRPAPGLIWRLDFLRCPPDAIAGEQLEWSAGQISTRSAASLSPSPRRWDILHRVLSMELDSTPKYERPRFMKDRRFDSESMLQDLFKNDFGSVRVLPPYAETTQILTLRRGKPDLVCLRAGSDPDLAESVLFPIVIKLPTILRSEDLVGDYLTQDQSGNAGGVLDPVHQIYGYIRLNGYRYGILSTYEQTWFMKRGDHGPNDLMISPAIASKSQQPTLLQCYLWFIREASADARSLDPPTEEDRKQMLKDARQNDERRRCRTVDRVALPDFEGMELISYNERARTYKALWQGRAVVLKKCDIWNEDSVAEELKNEARIYKKLQTLQGRYIPKLLLAGVADGVEMVLVTESVGTDVSQELLDDSALVKIREAMAAIHELGVVHGDIRLENIVMQDHGPNAKFYFVDFGFSDFTADVVELYEEKATLNSLLRVKSSA
ncbi:hypothetical protein DFQ27_007628 [Actinomortierella ambigua]|uniref:Protein kinase domain-containing protein n=1 Tax=Actinomortierella ambigua TaxID=1343610 RepID=A0A9P6TYW8_9FUNG|nr:hypothetical protein DFQ27_007628 [Actinomortierella ambigua]